MSNFNKAAAAIAKRDIGFRGLLQAAMGLPVQHTPSPVWAKMAAGIKISKSAKNTMDAFADANYTPSKGFRPFDYNDPAMGEAMQKRDLHFRSRKWMSVKEWTALMALATPRGYNDFDAKRAGRWLAGVERKYGGPLKLQPARESSVCVYIRGPRETLEAIVKAGKRRPADVEEDFWEKEGEEVRLWWD